jgi:hypothetical protein
MVEANPKLNCPQYVRGAGETEGNHVRYKVGIVSDSVDTTKALLVCQRFVTQVD